MTILVSDIFLIQNYNLSLYDSIFIFSKNIQSNLNYKKCFKQNQKKSTNNLVVPLYRVLTIYIHKVKLILV